MTVPSPISPPARTVDPSASQTWLPMVIEVAGLTRRPVWMSKIGCPSSARIWFWLAIITSLPILTVTPSTAETMHTPVDETLLPMETVASCPTRIPHRPPLTCLLCPIVRVPLSQSKTTCSWSIRQPSAISTRLFEPRKVIRMFFSYVAAVTTSLPSSSL